ncbi:MULTISPECIES: FecR family protein [Stenotrophomonas]|uniref:LysM peptidoglycan-binding domain-containing protein n=1 Tax=Stenotrophomonas rhizophila TaxID=216778 RepID=A0A7V7YDH2_9GAMM|nr:FecR domain-containing protein [Stenotrophomonas rhizophila]KAB7628728.1 LysM peptidoglycan-binding domain-containing protein [Stenotrophomonas rhizophila]MBU2050397.1 FecR domain-containing protein [Gammaproteobacteria bacterium]
MAARLLVLAAMMLSAAPVLAQDWTYRVRPGDTIWDLSARYLKPSIAWEQLQSHNGIADPYRLPPGSQLRFPVAWLQVQPAPARVLAVRGPVQSQADGQPHREVIEGDLLRIGQELVTGEDASVTVVFADDSRLQLRERSRLRFDQLSRYGRTGMVDTRLRLEQGRASNRVTPANGPASRYIIDAPTATSSVRGTVFRVSAGQDGRGAATEVLEGRVQVGNPRGQRLVSRGQATRSPSLDARPAGVEALLPAPVLSSEPQRLATLPAALAWQPVTDAAGYRVEVVRADQPEVLLFARDTDATTLTLPDLPPGELRLLVRAVSAEQVEGLDAEQDFQVRDQPVAPLTVRPLHGQTINSARPRFEWTRVAEAERTVLQIARDPLFLPLLLEQDTRATHLRPVLDLPPGEYVWRVASVDRNGDRGRFGQPLPLTITDEPVDPALQPPEAAKGQLTLRWQAGEPGQRYRVQLDRRGDFRAPLLDQELDQPEVSIKRPWHGTLHVRVQYIDEDGYAGPFSPAQQIALPCRTCYATGGGALLLLLLL